VLAHPRFAGPGSRHCLKYAPKEIHVSLQLTITERKALKARAHALEPTVHVGNGGLTDAVAGEISRSLAAHELIKIRVLGDDRAAREAILQRVCDELDAAPVQHIGKILVVYRPAPEGAAKSAAKPKTGRKPGRKQPRALKRSFQHKA
jgi:putative YhbY family RNA-binding protein